MNEEKKKHIPGIYNYCDRWCERCSFTSQCLLFSNESKIATFEIMNDRLPNAEEMMDEIFEIGKDEEDGFDMTDDEEKWDDFSDDPDENDFLFNNSDEDEDEEEIDFDDEKEPPYLIEDIAHQYFKEAHELIKKIDEKFNFSSTPKDSIALPQLKKIFDCFDIITWYHSFLYVKIKRAAHGKKEFLRFKNKDMREFSKSDSDGTAKVAAISVKNSIKALAELHEYLPDFGNEIIKLSSLLQRVSNELKREFPDYDKFIRPGLDD